MSKAKASNPSPSGQPQKSDDLHDFYLERYKYILQQIHTLNENIHKYLSLFQVLTVAIVGGGVAVFVSWQKLEIPAEIARTSIHGLLGLLVVIGVFISLSIIAGIISWFDYRREEVELLTMLNLPRLRQLPKLRNFWRWYEFYIILVVIIVVVSITIFVENQVIPRIVGP